MAKRLAPPAERFVGRIHELHRVDVACTAALHGQGSLTVVSGEPGIGKTSFCEEVAARAEAAGLTVVTARCWGESGAPPLWPWQPILAELGGDGAADLLASEAGHDLGDRDPDRFARFTSVTDRLAEACALSPVCLIVDDVHAADAGTLLLLRFVARSLPVLPLALVLSRRSGEPGPTDADTRKAELLDDIEREATPVVLAGFDHDETVAFLAGYGLDDLDADVALAVHRVTAGNPLFLRRVAALGKPGSADSLPGGLHLAIEQALARLGPETQRILRATSVLLEPAGVAVAAAVAGTDAASLVDAVSEAAPVGLVALDGDGRFVFGHELIRLAVEETLTGAERLDANVRAAEVVVGDGPIPTECLGRRAQHALAAAARSEADARRAVAACETAAESMVACSAYEQADAMLSAAVGLYESPDLGSPPARLLLRWAQAAHRCGRLSEARQRFDRAAVIAQAEDDPAVFAEVALGLGGHWVNEYRASTERARVMALQRAALAGLPADQADHEVLRIRLEARLAAEDVIDGEASPPIAPVHAALDAARRSGDPLALAEALSLSINVLFTPEHTHGRLELADELVRVASEAGYGVLGLMGLCWRAANLFCAGDERAATALADMRERANALASRHIQYMVGVMEVMLLLRAGRLDEAESAATGCYELGEAIGEIDAFGYLSGQLFAIRWLQGRDTELLDLADQVAVSPTLHRANFAFRAAVAAFTARSGRPERARAQLRGLTAGGLADLPQSSTWLVGMAAIVDAAAAVDDPALAREAYELLVPYADLPVMGSLAVICLGSTEGVLGMAALAFGDPDRAAGHLRRAVAENRRLGHRPMVAIAQADLARALDRRDRAGDRSEAAELLDEAVAEAEALGLADRAAAWRDERAALDLSPDEDQDEHRDRPGPVRDAPRRGVIRRDGARWTVAIDGHRVRVGDLVGMSYLAELLLRPGQTIPALTLASQGAAPREAGRHELLDDEARAAYAARAQELTADLAEAEADNDIGRAEQLRVELDALIEQLEAATGLSGRPRNFTDPTERARTAVRKAIKRAIDVVDDANPAIADVLRTSVTTGITCTYAPDPHRPVVWSTTEPADPAEPADPPRSGLPEPRSDERSRTQDGLRVTGGGETIRERLHSARQRWFVGRGEEIRLVRSALAADDPAFSVLFVHGPGGVGKTALLGAFAGEAGEAGVRAIHLDMHTIEPTPAAFVERFAAGLGWEPGDVTLDSLAACGRVLVLIDTLELAAPLDTWLRETFIVHLPADALVVIAGRYPPSPRWLADAAWRGLSRVAPLGDLPPVDTRRYLALRGIEEPAHDRLLELTHGHPLALSLVADVLDQRPPGGERGDAGDVDLVDAPDVVRMLMERFVGEVPDPRHREALAVCAHVRSTTEDLLRAALGGDDAGDLLAWLRSRSFVEEGRYGLFPHDLARDVLDTDLRWRDRVAYEDLHGRVRAHICERIRGSRGLAQQRAIADLLFLHRLNPVMRPLFDWQGLGQVHADRLAAGGADHDRVVAIAERHHGEAEAALVRHWLERQPGAFVVFRRGERDVAGFTAFLRLHEASPDDLAADPGSRALWAYATRNDPPRPGEAVTAVRFLVDAELGQGRPAPSWTAFTIAHILHTMETPRLAWDFIAPFRSVGVEPVFAYIDYHRVPDAEFTAAGARHAVFAHDWRRLGWDAFLEMMGERELDEGPGVVAPPPFARHRPPVLSQPEFADAVRAALRDRHRPDRLEGNP